MAKISFKTKVKLIWVDDIQVPYIDIPVLTRRHVDINEFRKHPKWGAYANSDLFPNILARFRYEQFRDRTWILLSNLPKNISIDQSNFLAVVSWEV